MSRLSYQFATDSGTSWTHSVTCDVCRAQVTREGELPKLERERGPLFVPGALRGWAQFSMRSTTPPTDKEGKPLDLEEEFWPHLDRDLCPSCAKFVHSWLCDIGCDVGTHEERYLDALGRPVGGKNEAVGVPVCYQPYGVASVGLRCLRVEGHEGEHGLLEYGGTLLCPVCFASRADGAPRSYTPAQLESHGVDQHSVRHSEGLAGAPVGWYSERENPAVVYADVQTALLAESRRIASEQRGRAPRFTRRPLTPEELSWPPWVHECDGLGGDQIELLFRQERCPHCAARRPAL